MNTALEMTGVEKSYGRRRALDGLHLAVPAGSIYGLVGSNGAGKTTTMALAAGFIRPDAGEIRLFGGGPFDSARHAGRLSVLPQDSELPRDARPLELLRFYAALQGLDARAAAAAAADLLERVHLSDRAKSPVRTLSHGMRKRIMIAQCFLGTPELVLLDEPLSGLDPREAARIRELILAHRGRQTLVISSHNLHEIELLCDRVAFIEKGRTVREDTLEAITGRAEVLIYQLEDGAAVPLEALAGTVVGATFEHDAAAHRLVCRYNTGRSGAAAINRQVLPRLFEAGIGVLAVQQGERLESEYLRQSNA